MDDICEDSELILTTTLSNPAYSHTLTVTGNPNDPVEVGNIQTYLNSLGSLIGEISISASLLEPGVEYTFTFETPYGSDDDTVLIDSL